MLKKIKQSEHIIIITEDENYLWSRDADAAV